MTVNLPITSLIEWSAGADVCRPTEHNRDNLNMDVDRMKQSDRMANGRLREYYVADKRTWSVSWTMLPAPSSETVDGAAGGAEMEEFYNTHPGEIMLTIKHKDSNLDFTVPVVLSSFDKTHVARGAFDMWDLSVSMEEV